MIDMYYQKQSSIISVETINKKDSDKYGIIESKNKDGNLYKIKSIVEKPSPKNAKSNIAVVGRFILTSTIFSKIEKSKPGSGK